MSLVDSPRAVVTGAGSGLGRAFCLELARRNARIVCADIDEASAKIRTGPPADAKDDLSLPVWAGVVPFELMRRDPLADNEAPVPGYLERFLAG